MSVRSHVFVAAVPLALWFGASYAWQTFMEGKLLETSSIDIRLSKTLLRTCGAEKLRSLGPDVRVKDDSLGGLLVDYEVEQAVSLQVIPLTDTRTRIQGAWRMNDSSDAIRIFYQKRVDVIAEQLLSCAAR